MELKKEDIVFLDEALANLKILIDDYEAENGNDEDCLSWLYDNHTRYDFLKKLASLRDRVIEKMKEYGYSPVV